MSWKKILKRLRHLHNDFADPIALSRQATVKIEVPSLSSAGTGFFIGDLHVATCMHVIGKVDSSGDLKIGSDIRVNLANGETLGATVVSIPNEQCHEPRKYDFAVLRLSGMPKNAPKALRIADGTEELKVGEAIYFSGHPLNTPGQITHKGQISGLNVTRGLVFVQASVNKGNSGGALLNSYGEVIGIISMREGGISKGLSDLVTYIDSTSGQGSVQIMGMDPLATTRAIISTLDTYISTGIGYAHDIRFLREHLVRHPLA